MSRLDELLAQVPQEEIDAAAQEESGFFDVAGDILAAPFRGVEGAVQGVYNLGDFLTFDLLPDYDNRFLGTSSTLGGSIVEGITQFGAGMLAPGVGGLSVASKLGKLGKAQKLLAAGSKKRELAKFATAGAVTDFAFFDGQQGRLSDLIQQYPSLENPITDFLETDEDDTVLEGRLKNAIEGVGLGALTDVLIMGARGVKAGRKARGEGKGPAETDKAMQAAAVEYGPPRPTSLDPEAPAAPKPAESAEEFLAGVDATDLTGKPPAERLNIRNVSNQDGAKRYVKAVLQDKEARGDFDDVRTKSFEEQVEEASAITAEIADATGDSSLKNLDGVLKEKQEELVKALPALTAVRETMAEAARQASEIARKGSRMSQSEAVQLFALNQRLDLLTETAANMQRAVARQLGLQRYVPDVKVDVKLMPDSLINPKTAEEIAAQEQLLKEIGGGDAEVGLKRLRTAGQKFADAYRRNPMNAVALSHKGGLLKAGMNYWMNSILSGPTTHLVNVASGIATTAFLPMERALGQALTGNLDAAGRELKKYGYMFEAFSDSLAATKMTLKTGENQLDTSAMLRDDMARGINSKIDPKNDDMISMAQKYITSLINVPSRFLATEDEFFKQLNYRASVKGDLYQLAAEKGLSGDEMATFVAEGYNKITKNGRLYSEKNMLEQADTAARRQKLDPLNTPDMYQRFVKEFMGKNYNERFGSIAETGLSRARESTFTTPLTRDRGVIPGVGRAVNSVVQEYSALRFVLPFVRTPANLLDFFFKRMPTDFGSVLASKTKRDLLRTDPGARADFLGRMATGGMLLTGSYYLYASGRLTGSGPRDPSRRQLLEEAGWQPYSILVDGKYVSYRRLDPFAGFLAIVADFHEGASYAEDEDIEGIQKNFAGITFALAQFNKNRSFFQGLSNLLSAANEPEKYGPRLLQNYAGSAIPSFLSQLKPAFGDDIIREVRSSLDATRNRIPGLAEGIAPRRNIFGEVITRPTGPLAIDPFPYTEVKEDVISEEFMRIGQKNGISRPRATKAGLDLRNYTNSKGQTAYDRWQELHGKVKLQGKTMRDAMSRLIRSRDYQQLTMDSDAMYDSPRVNELKRLVSRYRAEAYKQLLREFDDLRKDDRNNSLNRKALRSGKSLDQLRALIGDE